MSKVKPHPGMHRPQILPSFQRVGGAGRDLKPPEFPVFQHPERDQSGDRNHRGRSWTRPGKAWKKRLEFTFQIGHGDGIGAGQGRGVRGGQRDNPGVEEEPALEALGAQPREEDPGRAALVEGGGRPLEHGIHLQESGNGAGIGACRGAGRALREALEHRSQGKMIHILPTPPGVSQARLEQRGQWEVLE